MNTCETNFEAIEGDSSCELLSLLFVQRRGLKYSVKDNRNFMGLHVWIGLQIKDDFFGEMDKCTMPNVTSCEG